MQKAVNIKNSRARFEFELIDHYTAGIVLTGTEIKSIRLSKARIADSFCEFNDRGELFVVNMSIDIYSHGTHYNHQPKASRKLLLNRKELKKLEKEVTTSGFTIVPLRLFLNELKNPISFYFIFIFTEQCCVASVESQLLILEKLSTHLLKGLNFQ